MHQKALTKQFDEIKHYYILTFCPIMTYWLRWLYLLHVDFHNENHLLGS